MTGEELTSDQLEQLIAYVQACRSQGQADGDISRSLAEKGWTAPQMEALERALVHQAGTPPAHTWLKTRWRWLCGIGCLALVAVLVLPLAFGVNVESLVTVVMNGTLVVLLGATVALVVRCAKLPRPWPTFAIVPLSLFASFVLLLLLTGLGAVGPVTTVQTPPEETARQQETPPDTPAPSVMAVAQDAERAGQAGEEAVTASAVPYRVLAGERGDHDLSTGGRARFNRDISVPRQATDGQVQATLRAAMEEYRRLHREATHLSVTAWWEGGESAAAYARIVWAPGGDWGAAPESAPMAPSTESLMSREALEQLLAL